LAACEVWTFSQADRFKLGAVEMGREFLLYCEALTVKEDSTLFSHLGIRSFLVQIWAGPLDD
jgi:hypothetical protein